MSKSRIFWRPLLVFVVVLGTLGAGTPKDRLKELKSELNEKRSSLKKLDEKERSLLLTIFELDRSLARLRSEYEMALERETTLQTKLEETQSSLANEEAREERLEKRLRGRLRAAYVLGENASARFFGETSTRSHLYREHMIERTAKNDIRLLAQHRVTQEEIRKLQTALHTERSEASANRQLIQEEKELLEATLTERKTAIERIESKKELGVRVVKEIVAEQRSVGRLIWQLRKENPIKVRGKGILAKGISWPVTGTLIKRFGTVRERGTGARLVSNGIHIRASTGKPVLAIGNGKIAYVGWMKGFGEMVIIDHGEGHHSLYAHLSKADVKSAQTVVAGQKIGEVGETGSLNGEKLYFELRNNGKPIDPVPHLKL